jgi:hypothetical protein
MKRINVNFMGHANDAKDKLCYRIFRQHGATLIHGVNTWPELKLPRCVTGDVPNDRVKECVADLQAADLMVVSVRDTKEPW